MSLSPVEWSFLAPLLSLGRLANTVSCSFAEAKFRSMADVTAETHGYMLFFVALVSLTLGLALLTVIVSPLFTLLKFGIP